MNRRLGTTTAALLSLLGATVAGAQVPVTGMSGQWLNATPGGAVVSNVSGDPATIRWGAAATSAGPSGFVFDSRTTPFDMTPGGSFVLGTLTHINTPISSGTGITGVDLRVTMSMVGSVPSLFSEVFSFLLNETPNTGAGSPIDDDIITVGPSSSGGQSFDYLGTTYFVNMLGFSRDGGVTFVNSFASPEGGSNNAQLWAELSTRSNAVPEPGTVVLLGTGLLGIAGVAHRRRRRA